MDKKKVLIIDDDPKMLRAIKAMLDDSYQVALATSGEQGVSFLTKKEPDVILLDYEMPGWDGAKTISEIRAVEGFSETPVIFSSGRDDDGFFTELSAYNPAGFVKKPPNTEKLKKAINEALELIGL